MSIQPEGKVCPNLGRLLVPNDPPARQAAASALTAVASASFTAGGFHSSTSHLNLNRFRD
jgi:hypothetical protein